MGNMFSNLPNEIGERYYALTSKEDQIYPDFCINNYKTVKSLLSAKLKLPCVLAPTMDIVYTPPPNTQAVEKGDKDIGSEYLKKVQKLDEKYSNRVIGKSQYFAPF